MAEIKRKAEAFWQGDLRQGKGEISSESGAIQNTPYSFATRFEDKPGTNPEELIAAAHAACYGMALAHTLDGEGYRPERVEVQATCGLKRMEEGFKISRMHLRVRGQVPDIDQDSFAKIARQAHQNCPVSQLLRPGLKIELDAALK